MTLLMIILRCLNTECGAYYGVDVETATSSELNCPSCLGTDFDELGSEEVHVQNERHD